MILHDTTEKRSFREKKKDKTLLLENIYHIRHLWARKVGRSKLLASNQFFFSLRLHYLLLITRKPLQKPAPQQWLLFFQLLVAQGEPRKTIHTLGHKNIS